MKGGRQFMKFGIEQISKMTENLLQEKMPYFNSIIVGDNSSGKSLLLKKLPSQLAQ